ncbi:MAG: aspartate 1-decarboxylase [Gammaproteobacteria bacterium]|nr:aspartate 1-decarboxylase [Gammaproteobacteria bacterium]
MIKTVLNAKLHRVTTTHAELDYEGSCAIDGQLLDVAGIHEYEQIHIYNVNNGERFVTYAIRAEEKSGIISVNGAAAHKARPGDLLIICTFAQIDAADIKQHQPTLVYVDAANCVTAKKSSIAPQKG